MPTQIKSEEVFINLIGPVIDDIKCLSMNKMKCRAKRPTYACYNVSPTDIVNINRGRRAINEPRKVAMYIAHQFTFLTVSEVAHFFGLSHYGDITAAKYYVSEEIKNNSDFRNTIDALLNILDLK